MLIDYSFLAGVAMQPETWNAIHDGLVGGWSIGAPFVGVLIGAYIANRNQRKQWVANNKKQEFQELISALTHAFGAQVNRAAPMVKYGPEDERACAAAEEKAKIAMSDRVFIQDDVVRMKILERWQTITNELESTRDTKTYAIAFSGLKADLVSEARKLMD